MSDNTDKGITPVQQAALQAYYASIMAPQAPSYSKEPIWRTCKNCGFEYCVGLKREPSKSYRVKHCPCCATYFSQVLDAAQQNRLALAQAQPGTYAFGQQLKAQRIMSAPVDEWPSYG